MADALLQKFRHLYGRARSVLERWSAAQGRASGLASSAASVMDRLPSLSDDARFGPLVTRFPHLPRATRDAQAEALDRILTSLRDEMALFHELVVSLEKIYKDAAQLVHALQPPPKAAGAVRRGPQPSLVECVVGLQDLWRIHRDEVVLKEALVGELHCDAVRGGSARGRGAPLGSGEHDSSRARPPLPSDHVRLHYTALSQPAI